MKFHEFLMRQEIQQAASLLAKVLLLPRRPPNQLVVVKEAQKVAHESTERYWNDPDSPLNTFLLKHGITPPGGVPHFAQGGVGRVYFVDQFAVKFTANRVEANVAQMVQGRKDLPAAVIDVEYLGDGIYVILQPYVEMDNVPNELKQSADYLTAVVDEHPEMNSFPKNPAAQKKLCRDALTKNGGNPSLLPHMISLMGVLTNLYKATGFHHNDAGPSNIGIHQGKVIIPDLGPYEPSDPLSALSQINKNRTTLGLPRHKSF